MTKRSAFPIMLCLCLGGLRGFPSSAPAGMDKRIRDETRRITQELMSIRRDIHAHPELGLREERTSAMVADYFRTLGLEVRTGIGGTGVVGTLRGGRPGPVVAMRGDMDGLAVKEETGLPFASKEKAIVAGREVGLMHACGHDVHTTVLMGVANVLSRFRGELRGTVLFIAQPAEEWGNGAKAMIEDGVFAGVMPQAFFAYHVDDTAKAGFVRYTPGFSGANCDAFTLKIKSEGCHGAAPSLCVDPIVVGAQIVVALQVLVSRQIDVHNDTVITVGQFHGGAAHNIIPREAELKATIRSYGEEQRQALKDKVTRLIAHLCEASGAAFELDYVFGTPALYNDPELLREMLPTMERVLGGKSFLLEGKPEMGGEDFSEFAGLAPAVMLDLGVVPKDIARTSVHSPTFIVDEDSIPVGVSLMSSVIWDYLGRHAN